MGKRRRDDGRLAQVSLDRPGTSDTLSPRLTLVQQLVLSRSLHCLPQHFFVLPVAEPLKAHKWDVGCMSPHAAL